MAKKKTKKVLLVYSDEEGGMSYRYTAIKPEKAEYKLALRRYHPRLRKHVMFKEKKIDK